MILERGDQLRMSILKIAKFAPSTLTVVSGRKAIVGLRHPVTIGNHISTEISKTSHPRDLKF